MLLFPPPHFLYSPTSLFWEHELNKSLPPKSSAQSLFIRERDLRHLFERKRTHELSLPFLHPTACGADVMARAAAATLSPEDKRNILGITEPKRPDSLLTSYSHHTRPELPTCTAVSFLAQSKTLCMLPLFFGVLLLEAKQNSWWTPLLTSCVYLGKFIWALFSLTQKKVKRMSRSSSLPKYPLDSIFPRKFVLINWLSSDVVVFSYQFPEFSFHPSFHYMKHSISLCGQTRLCTHFFSQVLLLGLTGC